MFRVLAIKNGQVEGRIFEGKWWYYVYLHFKDGTYGNAAGQDKQSFAQKCAPLTQNVGHELNRTGDRDANQPNLSETQGLSAPMDLGEVVVRSGCWNEMRYDT